ncbi:uncharacterized protein G2W53_017479 [Senna tora]|uniref:Uncharacterized protein n=1 Tax=Senna tora TaxID=362788 RepID=A0A834TU43_9FABA|nr:uncharacterized protein G2W53_017479 [Senna tora]
MRSRSSFFPRIRSKVNKARFLKPYPFTSKGSGHIELNGRLRHKKHWEVNMLSAIIYAQSFRHGAWIRTPTTTFSHILHGFPLLLYEPSREPMSGISEGLKIVDLEGSASTFLGAGWDLLVASSSLESDIGAGDGAVTETGSTDMFIFGESVPTFELGIGGTALALWLPPASF